MRRRELLFSTMAALAANKLLADTPEHLDDTGLVGRPAAPLQLKEWVNSPPLDIADLRGKVVLIRWWTQSCPFCEATAPTLRRLQQDYGEQGLQVIGIYHPKPAGNWDRSQFEAATREKQFTFPVALDADWTALRRWWLFQKRDWTSVSFLLDRGGIIRYVHPGGEFHDGEKGGLDNHAACQRDLRTITATIAQLLKA